MAERSPQGDESDTDADVDVGDDDGQFLQDASAQYDTVIDDIFEAMDEDSDYESDEEEYCVERKCNGVLDIALVGEVSLFPSPSSTT